MARSFASRYAAPIASVSAASASAAADRYLIVPCEADGCSDLAVIWDRLEEQVIDVISASASARYSEEDLLWDEGRAAGWADAGQQDWMMAA